MDERTKQLKQQRRPPLTREQQVSQAAFAIAKASLKWWRNKRPIGWTYVKHIANPRINCVGEHEDNLATAVAEYLTGAADYK